MTQFYSKTNVLLTAGAALAIAVMSSVARSADSAAGAAVPSANDGATTATPSATPDDGKTLSKRLNENDGVIVPPEANIDEGIKVQAPDPNPGTTRVIPPPGSPGGDPSGKPK